MSLLCSVIPQNLRTYSNTNPRGSNAYFKLVRNLNISADATLHSGCPHIQRFCMLKEIFKGLFLQRNSSADFTARTVGTQLANNGYRLFTCLLGMFTGDGSTSETL